MRRRRRHSSPFFVTPASAISNPAAAVETISAARCGSKAIPPDSRCVTHVKRHGGGRGGGCGSKRRGGGGR
jgi:hypothetical protein